MSSSIERDVMVIYNSSPRHRGTSSIVGRKTKNLVLKMENFGTLSTSWIPIPKGSTRPSQGGLCGLGWSTLKDHIRTARLDGCLPAAD